MLTLLVYSVLIAIVSLLGGWLPGVIRFTHVRLHALMSLVAGFMLGVACFHMLPHSVEHGGSLDAAMLYLMVGLLGMFFLVRALHFHQHGSVETTQDLPACDHDHDDSHAIHNKRGEDFALHVHGSQPKGSKASAGLKKFDKAGIKGYTHKSKCT